MAYQPPLGQDHLTPEQEQQPSQEHHLPHSPVDPLSSQPTPFSAMKKYNAYYTTSRTNIKLDLGSSSEPCVYYGESTFLTNKPQIQLRSGDSKSSPMVAFAKIHLTSRHVLLGSGDCQKDPEQSLVWEEMRRDKSRLQRGDYQFGTSVGLGPRKTYSWRVEKHLTKTVYRCVDDAGHIIASMLSGGMFNWRKAGEMEIAEGLEDRRLGELLIVSALAIGWLEAGWSLFPGYSSGHNGADKYSVDATH